MKNIVILISGRGSNMEAIVRAQIPGARIVAVISNRPDAGGLEFAARHGIEPQTEHFPMSRLNDALDHLRAGKARYRVVLDADFTQA